MNSFPRDEQFTRVSRLAGSAFRAPRTLREFVPQNCQVVGLGCSQT